MHYLNKSVHLFLFFTLSMVMINLVGCVEFPGSLPLFVVGTGSCQTALGEDGDRGNLISWQ